MGRIPAESVTAIFSMLQLSSFFGDGQGIVTIWEGTAMVGTPLYLNAPT